MYPLVPLVHRPTFMERFHNQDDHKDPVFLGLILSILGASLMQVSCLCVTTLSLSAHPDPQIPKDQIPVEAESISALAHRCHRTSRLVCLDHYDPPCLELVVLRFYDAVFNFCANRTGAWGTSFTNRLHSSSDGFSRLAGGDGSTIVCTRHTYRDKHRRAWCDRSEYGMILADR